MTAILCVSSVLFWTSGYFFVWSFFKLNLKMANLSGASHVASRRRMQIFERLLVFFGVCSATPSIWLLLLLAEVCLVLLRLRRCVCPRPYLSSPFLLPAGGFVAPDDLGYSLFWKPGAVLISCEESPQLRLHWDPDWCDFCDTRRSTLFAAAPALPTLACRSLRSLQTVRPPV